MRLERYLKKPKKIVRNVLLAIVSIVAFNFLIICELIVCSNTSFCDFFTRNKTSALKSIPKTAERNIIVDTCGVCLNGGVKVLSENIINGIAKKKPNWHFSIISPKGSKHPFNLNIPNAHTIYVDYKQIIEPIVIVRDIINFLSFGLFKDQITQLLFFDNVYFNKNSCDLYFDPCADFVINDYTIPKISLIHDLRYLDMPDYFKVKHFGFTEFDLKKKNASRIVESSRKIITVSDFTKQKIMEFYKADCVKVIHIKLANRIKNNMNQTDKDKILKKFQLTKQKYLIYPSTLLPHKNHKNLVAAFLKFLKKRNENAAIKLVIVGTINKKITEDIEKFINDDAPALKNNIIFTDFIEDESLSALLSDSLAMIFPSTYEGFGMPIIETMDTGIPVLCSNVTSLPEVAGNAALLFDPYNVDEIAKAINTMVTDSNLREKLIKLGYERAKYFSDQDSMIDEYIKVFEKYMTKTNNNVDS